jgi:hypothetical protein
MAWLKYHPRPFLLRRDWQYVQPDTMSAGGYFSKPEGLWITDDSDMSWWDWCMDENFCIERLSHKHTVDLDERNILILRTPEELDHFTLDYGMATRFAPTIHWGQVARDFHGLAITPYIWERRMLRETSWYYGWDCASACIWGLDAIASIDLVDVPRLAGVSDGPLPCKPTMAERFAKLRESAKEAHAVNAGEAMAFLNLKDDET